jgi:hypothetical protein
MITICASYRNSFAKSYLPPQLVSLCMLHGPVLKSSVASLVCSVHFGVRLFHDSPESTVREQLLRGLLGSDLLGFQTHNYARHFRQTCSRILSLEALPKGIQVENSFVDVAVFPIGIDVQDLTQKRCASRNWAVTFVLILFAIDEIPKLLNGRRAFDNVMKARNLSLVGTSWTKCP